MNTPCPPKLFERRPTPWTRWFMAGTRHVLFATALLMHFVVTGMLMQVTNYLGPVYWDTPWWSLPALSQGVDVGWALGALIFLVPGLPEFWVLGTPSDRTEILWIDFAVCMGPLLLWLAYEFGVYRPFRARNPPPRPGLVGVLYRTSWSVWKLGREEALSRLAKP